jgi:lipid-A-disaccharide synthase
VQILISAGEASGDMYGAELIEALRARVAGRVSFFGAGGDRMRSAGCDIVVDAKDLAVVGITEIVSHLPKILGLYKKLIRAADQRRPDLAVVIDSPAFNWRVARQMRKRGIPVVYYVCPQFWAWRQGRVKLLRKYVNKALVIFPFEEKFYRDRGVDATFVGHPLANLPAPTVTREAYAAEHGLDPAKQWITLMPGSRRKELRMNLPTIMKAIDRLGDKYVYLLPVAPTLDSEFVSGLIAFEGSELPKVKLVPEALPALFHSRAGVIASGTATVEAAIMGTPFVMVYRVSPLTYALGKPGVKVAHYAMVNLIASLGGRNNVDEVVPELIQSKFTSANIVGELEKITADGEPRTRMIQGLAAVKAKLRQGSGGQSPPEKAAEIILAMLGQKACNPHPPAEAAGA